MLDLDQPRLAGGGLRGDKVWVFLGGKVLRGEVPTQLGGQASEMSLLAENCALVVPANRSLKGSSHYMPATLVALQT
jgi:hypothetical protein